MSEKQEKQKRKMKKEEDVVFSGKGRICSPAQDLVQIAFEKKIWIEGNDGQSIDGVDYAMFDLLLVPMMADRVSEQKQANLTFMDVLKIFYSEMYPYIDTLIEEYRYVKGEYEGAQEELNTLLERSVEYHQNRRITLEFLKEKGMMEEYEVYKTKSLEELNSEPEERT